MVENNRNTSMSEDGSSPIAILVSNSAGLIEEANVKADHMFGFDNGGLIGKPIEKLLPEDLREKHIEHRHSYHAKPFTRAMGAGLDLIGRKKDGTLFPIEIGLSSSKDHDSVRVTSYIIDITERNRTRDISLNQMEQQREKTEIEFQMARKVQTSLLPDEIPDIPGWSFALEWLPAHEVGGDFYDVIDRKNGEYDVLIADVTDKGIPAALFMAFANTLLRSSIKNYASLDEGITCANQLICQASNQGLYITLFAARINSKKGEITYVNAGHNPPLHYSNRNGDFTDLDRTGMVLGFDHRVVYEQRTVQIEPKDFIVLYTDGVTEALDAKEQDFGVKGIRKVILDHRNGSVEGMVSSISKAVNGFIVPDTRQDDITIMIAQRE